MEFCDCKKEKEDLKQIERDILTNIRVMHAIKMVHRDIKEENIGWSPHFKKWVLLDYGFATFIKEDIGYKSVVSYIGTYQYCLKEMKQLYHLNRKGLVDLYYNDLHGFDVSLESLQQKMNSKTRELR